MKNPQRFQKPKKRPFKSNLPPKPKPPKPEPPKPEPTRMEAFLSAPSWWTAYRNMGPTKRQQLNTKIAWRTFWGVLGCYMIGFMIFVAMNPLPPDSDSDTYTRTRISDSEFNHSYNQYRDSGMSESEAGTAARATSNFLDKQRTQRAAEAARQK